MAHDHDMLDKSGNNVLFFDIADKHSKQET